MKIESIGGVILSLVLIACGPPPQPPPGDGGRDGTMGDGDAAVIDVPQHPDVMLCPGSGGEVSGTVYAPNGQDPLFGAVVYAIQGDPPPISPGVACDRCELPSNALGYTTSAADGHFSIAHATDAGGQITIVIQKGRFRRIVRLNPSDCSPVTLSAAQTSLPGASGPGVDFPHILVATSVNDDIGSVLMRVGITEFDRMDGCRGASTSDEVMNCGLGQLLADMTRLQQYNIVLLPCGSLGDYHTWQLLPQPIITSLQAFLQAGGRLYASDLSYGVIQRTFPAAFTFANGTMLNSMGEDPADVGAGQRAPGKTYEGMITDPDLRTWMGTLSALESNGNVTLTGFLNPWGAVDTAASTSTTWVHGSVGWYSPTYVMGDHPLTVEAEYRGANGMGCGRVVFTSYHTLNMPTAPLTPQERLLEWLLFELGGCETPG